jgi:hypothetical protein
MRESSGDNTQQLFSSPLNRIVSSCIEIPLHYYYYYSESVAIDELQHCRGSSMVPWWHRWVALYV